MSVSDYDITRLTRFYQTLGVPLDASTHSIKQTYRQILKRWHPDLYVSGTPAQAEATQMTKLINEAYSAIADAPLRYYIGSYSGQAKTTDKQPTGSSNGSTIKTGNPKIFRTGKIEVVVRFVCGALFGIFVCFDLVFSGNFDASPSLSLLLPGGLTLVLVCGCASARYGDKFWHSAFRDWWLWE